MMPVARFQMPDGRIGRFEVPDGTTPEQAKAMIAEQFVRSKPGPAEQPMQPFVPSGEREQPSWTSPEGIAGNPVTRFALGAASPMQGIQQIAEKAPFLPGPLGLLSAAAKAGTPDMQQLEGMKREGMRQQGAEGMDIAGMAGQIASPAVWGAAKALPAATSTAQRIGQGAMMGGGFGAATPVTQGDDFWGTKAAQAGTGLAVGAAIPAGIDAAKFGARTVRNIADPFLPGGVDRTVGRTAAAAAGDKNAEIVRLLRENKQIVPGSAPTAGEAAAPAGRAEFSGLQEAVRPHQPSAFDAVTQAQNAARVNALRTVWHDKAALASAEGTRSATANVNYGKAYEQAVRADPELLQLSQNPFFKEALPDAFRLAQAKGINPKTDLTQFLHFVKISLDKQVQRTGDTALVNTERAAVENVKKSLLNWMATKNPSYELARSTFAQQSQPINQMQVGQYLENKLVPAMSDQGASPGQRAALYAQALRDAPGTLKRATGQPRYEELGDVLSPTQVRSAQNVGADLGRTAEHDRLARLGSSKARELLGQTAPTAPALGMFNPKYSVLKSLTNRLAGRVEGKSVERLADLMRDPKKLADLMEKAAMPLPERQAVMAELLRRGLPGIVGQGASGAVNQ